MQQNLSRLHAELAADDEGFVLQNKQKPLFEKMPTQNFESALLW